MRVLHDHHGEQFIVGIANVKHNSDDRQLTTACCCRLRCKQDYCSKRLRASQVSKPATPSPTGTMSSMAFLKNVRIWLNQSGSNFNAHSFSIRAVFEAENMTRCFELEKPSPVGGRQANTINVLKRVCQHTNTFFNICVNVLARHHCS